MSIQIEQALDRFVTSKRGCAIVLQGKWGRGKTHAWKVFLKKHNQKVGDGEAESFNYAYVSLFGVDSISELKTSVYINSCAEPPKKSGKVKGYFQKAWSKASQVKYLASNLEKIEPKKFAGTSVALQIAATHYTKDMLICIDDLERRGKGLRLLDVLGLISYWSQQKNCRVLVILNPNSLGDDEAVWRDHREKVFDSEVTFDPEPAECVKLIFNDRESGCLKSHARTALVDLKVANIRIIERTFNLVSEIEERLTQGLPVEVLRIIATSLCLLVFCHFGRGDGAPDLEFVARTAAMGYRDEHDFTEEEKKWVEFLQAYGYYFGSEIDEVLRTQVVHGRLVKENFDHALRDLVNFVNTSEWRDAYNSAREKFRHTFVDNSQEVVDTFSKVLPKIAPFIGPGDADATMHMLRELKESGLASSFAESWVSSRDAGDLSSGLFDGLNRLTDKKLMRLVQAATFRNRRLPSLEDAFRSFEQHRADENDAESIASASVKELKDYLARNPTAGANKAVHHCLSLSGMEEDSFGRAKKRVVETLETIASEYPSIAGRLRARFAKVWKVADDRQSG